MYTAFRRLFELPFWCFDSLDRPVSMTWKFSVGPCTVVSKSSQYFGNGSDSSSTEQTFNSTTGGSQVAGFSLGTPSCSAQPFHNSNKAFVRQPAVAGYSVKRHPTEREGNVAASGPMNGKENIHQLPAPFYWQKRAVATVDDGLFVGREFRIDGLVYIAPKHSLFSM
jgi:hypothetical protein